MNDGIINIAIELLSIYGNELLEDPDRFGQLLEENCRDSRQEVFLLTFALREINRGGFWVASFDEEAAQKWELRLRENLGFSEKSANWVVKAIQAITLGQAIIAVENEDNGVVACAGNYVGIGTELSKTPRTATLRKTALNRGVILLLIMIVFSMFFYRINISRYPSGDELALGFLGTLTGPGAEKGQAQLRGAQLAVAEINKMGGVSGKKVHVVGLDIPNDAQEATARLSAIIKKRPFVAMISSHHGKTGKALAQLADQLEVPLVTIGQTDESILMKGVNRPWLYSFHLSPAEDYQAKLLAYFTAQGLNRRAAIVIYDPKEDENLFRQNLIRWMEAFGIAVVQVPLAGEKNAFVQEIKRIQGSVKEKSLIVIASTRNTVNILEALEQENLELVVLGQGYSEELWGKFPKTMEGSWWIRPVFRGDNQLTSFQRSYRDAYNQECSDSDLAGALLAYDAVKWIADAYIRAGSDRGEPLRHALLSTKNQRLTHATLTIDPRTHAPSNKAAALIHGIKGKGRFKKRFWPH